MTPDVAEPPTGALRTLTAPSRTGLVLEALRHAILSGELPAGRPLVEVELARSLGVSKTPVREALKTLSGAGLVTMTDYAGAVVRVVDERLTRDVFETRCLLEPAAVQQAVTRGLGPHAGTARAALAAAAAATDEAGRSLANRDFHRALYVACDNDVLIGVLDHLRDQTALISVNAWTQRPSWEAEADEHALILRAAEAGDAEEAGRLVLQHIAAFQHQALRGFGDER
ncbi:GntR family transcriptional regulator [Kineococcus sp. SYSU DK001]|uniref:GntR family transcriptional regulator n=1 Tax=Kineococcus sp. SYSU DK001 TaxID=3383122 RepID=UPI003D7E61B5